MAEQSSSGAAFGVSGGEGSSDESWLGEDLAQQVAPPGGGPEAAAPAPAEEGAPAGAPAGETPAGGVPAPAEGAPTPPAGEDGALPAAEQFRFAGREFADQSAAEQSYQHMQALQTRVSQQMSEQTQRLAEYEQAFREIQPYIPQLQQIADGKAPAPAGAAPAQEPAIDWTQVDWNDPDAARRTIQASMRAEAERVATERFEQLRTEMAASNAEAQNQFASSQEVARYQESMTRSITDFRTKHPDVPANSPADQEFAQFIGTHQFQGRPALDIADPEQLELAYEMWKNPTLDAVISVNPHYAATDGGRQLARQFATGSTGAAPNGAPAQGQPGTARPAAPHVETGGTGAPAQAAPGDRPPEDEFAEVLALGDAFKGKDGGVFFGG